MFGECYRVRGWRAEAISVITERLSLVPGVLLDTKQREGKQRALKKVLWKAQKDVGPGQEFYWEIGRLETAHSGHQKVLLPPHPHPSTQMYAICMHKDIRT